MIARAEVEAEDQEITLSTASLLGLFVGLALVCGLFFGFGYSVGRREQTSGVTTASAKAGVETEATPPLLRPSEDRAQETEKDSASPAPAKTSPPAQPVTLPIVEAPLQTDAAKPAEIAPPPKLPVAIDGGQSMVQVAAVFRQEDADVLVSALRQRGYKVLVRNEPQDKLLHVQVGPFPNRAQANAMKQRLASDGYNAIVRQ